MTTLYAIFITLEGDIYCSNEATHCYLITFYTRCFGHTRGNNFLPRTE